MKRRPVRARLCLPVSPSADLQPRARRAGCASLRAPLGSFRLSEFGVPACPPAAVLSSVPAIDDEEFAEVSGLRPATARCPGCLSGGFPPAPRLPPFWIHHDTPLPHSDRRRRPSRACPSLCVPFRTLNHHLFAPPLPAPPSLRYPPALCLSPEQREMEIGRA